MTAHLVPLAFLAFLTACAVTGIITDYKKRKAALEPLRAAIERGQQLDPATVERLMAPEKPSGVAPMSLMAGGIVVSAAGVGVMILSILIAQENHSALFPILGGGIVALCVGAGLIIASRAVEQYRSRQPHGPNGG
jgi:hypothetical protein